MTFFLRDETPERRGPNAPLPGNTEAFGASMQTYWQSINVLWQRERQVIGERDGLATRAATAMGPEGLGEFVNEYNERAASSGLGGRTLSPDMTPDEIIAAVGPNGSRRIVEMAREKAAQDPERFKELDLTDEGIEARVTEKRQQEAASNAEMIALSPNPVRNDILGSLAAGVLDPVNIVLAPFGLGAGSFLRVLGREALLGGGAEALQFPTRSRVAEELGQEAPDFVSSVAQGAAAGVVLGGALEGAVRGFRGYAQYQAARRLERREDVSPVTQEAAVLSAERAAAEGGSAFDAAAKAILDEPPPPRRPLILDDASRVSESVTAETPEPTALAPDPITTESLPPAVGEAPQTPGETAALAERALSKATRPAGKKPTDLSTFVVRSGGIWKGDDRGELAAMEYRRPGFLKTARFARSTAGDNGGGHMVDEMREAAAQAGYLPMESTIADFLDALDGDRRGNKRYAMGEIGPTSRKTYDPDYEPQRAWADDDIDDRGFMVDLERYEFSDFGDVPGGVARDVDRYLEEKGYILQPRDKQEILAVLTTRGGDARDLIHSAIMREIEEGDYAILRSERGEAYGRQATADPIGEDAGLGGSPDPASRGAAGEPQAAGRDAAEPGDRAGEFASERTDAGTQLVIPGAERVAPNTKGRDEAEIAARQLQSKIRRLNQVRVEDEVDGLFAVKALDLFDDLNSPQAKSFMDENMQAMRAMLEDGDMIDGAFTAAADDGRALNSLSDILDEIDDEATLMREFDLCRFGGGTPE